MEVKFVGEKRAGYFLDGSTSDDFKISSASTSADLPLAFFGRRSSGRIELLALSIETLTSASYQLHRNDLNISSCHKAQWQQSRLWLLVAGPSEPPTSQKSAMAAPTSHSTAAR